MLSLLSRFHPSIFTVIFLGVLFGNAAALHSPLVGTAALLVGLATFGSWVGRLVAPGERGMIRAWIGAWVLLSAVMIVGAACYYLAAFTLPAALSVAGLMGPCAWLVSHRHRAKHPHELVEDARHRIPGAAWLAAALVVAALAAVLAALAGSATTDAVRSTWDVVPTSAFVAFFVAALGLAALLFRGRERAMTLPLASALLLTVIVAAILVFPLGFGFDPFIHQATEAHIAEFGTISPKPFYYIGQYALVLFLHHAFSVPIGLADALLVPVLTALLLPVAWYGAAAHLLRDKQNAASSLLGLFLLPLGAFIATTPQGLANLWTLLLVLAAVPYLVREEKPNVWPLAIPALAAALTHPIAGLPAVLFVALLASDPSRTRQKMLARAIFWTGVTVGSVLLPLSFVANSLRSSGSLGLNLSGLSNLSILSSLSLFLANRFNPLLDFVYLYGYNASFVFLIVALAGWWLSRKAEAGALRILALMAGMLAVNWFLLSTAVDFSFLIDYERQNFAARLVPLALFFLTPFVILAVGAWTDRARRAPVSLRVATVVLAAAVATASFYLAYPRNDAYEAGHGYNVSRTDVSAVHTIEEDADGAPYVVLANQTVSAAAVRELGFVRYYGDQFFYPIPTGGELYEQFLAMNATPTRDIANAAAAIADRHCAASATCAEADVAVVYYVVNAYWWEAPRIVETAKGNADAWWALDNAAVHVFRYDITN